MDANSNGKASKSGEISMTEEENKKASSADAGGAEVVILISGGEVSKARNSVDSAAAPMSCCPSPEIARFSPSPKRAQTLAQRKSFTKSVLSIPESRFEEQYVPRTPLMESPGGFGGEDEDEQIYKKVIGQRKLKYHRVKMKVLNLIEWIVFFCILGIFVASLTVHKLQHYMILGLEVWKWSLLVLVTFSGMLVTKWFIRFVVFLIERNFLFGKNVLYFVHGLKKSVQACLWLGLVLLTWVLLFDRGMDRSPKTTRILDRVTRTIVSLFIGSFLWLVKTLLITILASSVHRSFDRIQESVLHQYILLTLSGPPLMEQMIGRESSNSHLSFRSKKKKREGKEKELIDVHKLLRMKQEKVSAWYMKRLVDAISSSGLSTISNSLDEDFYGEGDEQMDKEITNEMEAIAAAYYIFKNVARPESMYIYEDDLMRFMIKEEVDLVFSLVKGSETRCIDKKALMEWVVKVYKGRKTLSHGLKCTKTAVKHLNKLLTGSLLLVMVIVWLILVEIAATQVLVFVSSQLVVAAFYVWKSYHICICDASL